MTQNQNLEQKKSDLIDVGFQPSRYGFLVKPIRRIIWPFIRAFHFHHLERDDLFEQKFESFEHKFDQKIEQYMISLVRLTNELVLLRSEIAALKNNYLQQDSLVANEIVAIKDHCGQQDSFLANEIEALKDHCGQQGSLLASEIEDRHTKGLALTSTKYGIFIGKNGDIISEVIAKGDLWDKHIIELANEVSIQQKGGKAIDVGAHLGSITLALASMFEEVFSFEPNDFNFRILQSNVVINRLDNVRLFNSCLYSHSTILSLGNQEKQEIDLPLNNKGEFDGNLANNLGAYLFDESGSGLFEHSARTLDTYEFNDISFIKIDVQGADGEVILGSLQTIQRCQPVIVFEWEESLSNNFSVKFDSLMNELKSLGYEISQLKVHNEKQIDYLARPTKI